MSTCRQRSPAEIERLRLEREAFIQQVEREIIHQNEALQQRIFQDPVLQAYFRPDLFDERYMRERPSRVVVEQAIESVFKTTSYKTLQRILKREGVSLQELGSYQMKELICLLFFTKLQNTDNISYPPYPAGLGLHHPE